MIRSLLPVWSRFAVGSAVELLECEAVSIIGWHNYAAKTGFEETLGAGNHRFENLVFGKRPGTNRLMGGEGVMSNACRRGSRWRNVSISLTTDDLFKFHGYRLRVMWMRYLYVDSACKYL